MPIVIQNHWRANSPWILASRVLFSRTCRRALTPCTIPGIAVGKKSTADSRQGSRYVRTCGAARGSVVLVPSVTLSGTLVRVALLSPSARGYGVM